MATSSMATAPPVDDQEIKNIEVKAPEPQKVGMSISGGPFGAVHSPIHESLTLSALSTVVGSGVPATATESSADDPQWEYIRGVIWNDDPACELFWKSSWFDNHTHSGGVIWLERYHKGEKQWDPSHLSSDRFENIIGRSHYGDMQWLHAMGAVAGEDPHETKRKLMIWMEVMYKLASGVSTEGINADTLIRDTKLDSLLAASSGGGAVPSRDESLRALLAPNDSYKHIDTRRRALGSLFHVIQDSYAVGHVRRVPLNTGDRIKENPLEYKPGVADRWGEILNFHTYRGQNDDDHKLYDHTDASVPNKNNLHDIDQWNSLIGCRDGVDKCSQLARGCFEGRKWEGPGGMEEFLSQEVFAVSAAATPSDNTIL